MKQFNVQQFYYNSYNISHIIKTQQTATFFVLTTTKQCKQNVK